MINFLGHIVLNSSGEVVTKSTEEVLSVYKSYFHECKTELHEESKKFLVLDDYILSCTSDATLKTINIYRFSQLYDDTIYNIVHTLDDENNTLKQIIETIKQHPDEGKYLEELMKINNEYIRLQRKMDRTNRDLELLNKQLSAVNDKDYLTQLFNRRKFFKDAQLIPENIDKTLVMMDFNNFKLINDQLGHEEGDHCLKLFAKEMATLIIPIDGTLYRLGGDEFAVIAQKTPIAIFEKMVDQINDIIQTIHKDVSMAFGFAIIRGSDVQQGIEIETFMSIADKAMYKTKTKQKQVEAKQNKRQYRNI